MNNPVVNLTSMAEQLSTKALTVYSALLCAGPELQLRLAAAIEALADQVVPEETWLETEETCYAYYCQRSITRRQLLAIAAEIKSQ